MSSQLSIAAKKLYIEQGGLNCPFCSHGFITAPNIPTPGEDRTVFPKAFVQTITCEKCQRRWKEVYRLKDIEEIP